MTKQPFLQTFHRFMSVTSLFCLNVASCGSLFLTSQANDSHPAPAVHSKQRDHPAKENQQHSAFPLWTWIQEGQQHSGQQEVNITPLTSDSLWGLTVLFV